MRKLIIMFIIMGNFFSTPVLAATQKQLVCTAINDNVKWYNINYNKVKSAYMITAPIVFRASGRDDLSAHTLINSGANDLLAEAIPKTGAWKTFNYISPAGTLAVMTFKEMLCDSKFSWSDTLLGNLPIFMFSFSSNIYRLVAHKKSPKVIRMTDFNTGQIYGCVLVNSGVMEIFKNGDKH